MLDKNMLKEAAKHSIVGFEIALCIILGYLAGNFLDGYFDIRPVMSIFMTVCGLGAAIKVIVRIITQTDLDKS